MGQLKYHNGTTWVPIEDGVSDYSAFVLNDILSGATNGTNRVFTTTRNFASISLYVNGVKQNPGVGNDYQVTGANQVTFEVGSEPATGSVVTADFTTSSSYTVTGTNSFVRKQVVTGAINGTNKIYVTAQPYVGASLEVFVNGLKQAIAHVAETTPATGTFTLDEAPVTGSVVEVAYMIAGVPSGNADTLDTFHASTTAAPNTILPLDSTAKFIPSALPTGTQIRLGAQTGGGLVMAGAPTWSVLRTVTATSRGGECEIDWSAIITNGNSGGTRTFDVDVTCDGVSIQPFGASFTSPISGTEYPRLTFSFRHSSTPTPGSHTWTLRMRASIANAIVVSENTLKITEIVA